jgi:hypothetical protein
MLSNLCLLNPKVSSTTRRQNIRFLGKCFNRLFKKYSMEISGRPDDGGSMHISETSVYFHETARHYIPEGCHLHTRRRDNLKSHLFSFIHFCVELNRQ